MNVDVSLIAELQRHTDRIRNVCVLAHVDHGKTTLSDHLIASNGLIHPRLAGELRYMDSREEEQARGITMKSSSISLLYVPGAATRPGGPAAVTAQEKAAAGLLFNLIDSPGHVDFCSEVSTAARLSDGALVVVDAVEGVCIQTHAVLRQAWEEKVRLCLVLNKVDRLVLELRLTPAEAYERLAAIVAHVNMVVSAFHSERYISEADAVLAHEDAKGAASGGVDTAGGVDAVAAQELEERERQFSPEKGNVAFASAHDGWAFRLGQFAEMYAARMGCNPGALLRALWGDYAYQPKARRIARIRPEQRGKLKPLFVQLALEPIWRAYAVCDPPAPGGESHPTALAKIVAGLGLEGISQRELQHADPRVALRAVLRAWLPLPEAVLGMAAEHLPSPRRAASERLPSLLPPRAPALKGYPPSPELQEMLDRQEAAIAACDASPDAPAVVYVSKMVAVPASALPRAPGEPGPADPAEERFLAFGRVFSGVLRAGQRVHVLPSVYNPAAPGSPRQGATAAALYLMMGRGLERLEEVPAGNVLAIAGLDTAILKSATVASTPLCRPLAPLLFQSAPIVRVAVEPARPGDMAALAEGLRLLHKADPMVQVSVQGSGEHVLCAAGEVHLETCVKDLRERFARVELLVSPPLVAFRETVLCRDEEADAAAAGGGGGGGGAVVEAATAGGACTIRVRALPLPAAVASALDQNGELLRAALTGQAAPLRADSNGRGAAAEAEAEAEAAERAAVQDDGGAGGVASSAGGSASLADLGSRLAAIASGRKDSWLADALQRVWAVGPKHCGPNLLLSPPAASAAGRPALSLWEVPQAQVVALAKLAPGRAAGVAALAPPGKHGQPPQPPLQPQQPHGQEAVEREQYRSGAQAPLHLHLGSPEVSQRLELCPRQPPGAGPGESSPAPALPRADGIASELAARLEALGLREEGEASSCSAAAQYLRYSIEAGMAAGFQLATAAGPLCDEPMWGVAFEVAARLNPAPEGHDGRGGGAVALSEDVYGPFTGQVTSAARQAFRRAVFEAGPRLAEAAYLCEVSTSSEGLAAVYAVLGRRRCRVLREEMREGSGLFTVHAHMPAEASFGFADELRRRSSGAAAASLMLSHWERLQVDPFFAPVTEEQREEYGEEGQGVGAPNLARRLIDAVRRRKGLPVEEKVVESATRQRTRARKV